VDEAVASDSTQQTQGGFLTQASDSGEQNSDRKALAKCRSRNKSFRSDDRFSGVPRPGAGHLAGARKAIDQYPRILRQTDSKGKPRFAGGKLKKLASRETPVHRPA
jgi:hypothetical protein